MRRMKKISDYYFNSYNDVRCFPLCCKCNVFKWNNGEWNQWDIN